MLCANTQPRNTYRSYCAIECSKRQTCNQINSSCSASAQERKMKAALRRRRKKARYSPKASPGTHPWQDFHFMYPKRELGRKYRPFVATYRRYVSKMRWFWQDLRAVYLKSPANHRLRIHRVQILPGKAPFPVRCVQNMHSAQILPFRPAAQRECQHQIARTVKSS